MSSRTLPNSVVEVMSDKNKVVWWEGLFLRPQHFQQQERYLERFVEERAGGLRGDSWGFLELELESELLAIGKVGLRRARGVFPDGTPFSMPDHDPLPAPIEIGQDVRNRIVYLTLPLRRQGATETIRQPRPDVPTRYLVREIEARDVTIESGESVPVEVSALRGMLTLEGTPLDDLAWIPLARIVECRTDRRVVLDDEFMPTAMSLHACAPLARSLTSLIGLFRQVADTLAREAAVSRGGSQEIADFMKLMIVNRFEPLAHHLSRAQIVHPEDLYRVLVTMMGELATLGEPKRRPEPLPDYRHVDLRASFAPVIERLQRYLSISDRRVIRIPIEAHPGSRNLFRAVVPDPALFDNATFVLAVASSRPLEDVRREFPNLATLASAPKLRELVMHGHQAGLPFNPLPTVPPRLPFYAGSVYFEIGRAPDRPHLWRDARESGQFGLFVRDDFPDLRLELWAMKD